MIIINNIKRQAEATIQIEASMTCNVDEVDESNKPPPLFF
jgi:hypothetical protein